MPYKWWIIKSLLLLIFTLSGCEQKPSQFNGETMGSTYQITVVDIPNDQSADVLEHDIARLLADAHARLTTYDPKSELNRFNAAPVGEWITLSPILSNALKIAYDNAAITSGAFDPTVAPLVDLWGFGPGKHNDEVPSDADINTAKSLIGYTNIELENSTYRARKLKPLRLDLSGLGHGYGADLVANYLDEKKVRHYLIDVAGEIRSKGHRPNGDKWRVAIEKPIAMQGGIFQGIYLNAMGLATSGDYRNYFEQNGIRYSHTIDPQTGRPITHTLTSVTVLDKSAARADALATALLVLGPKRGQQLADLLNLPVYFIVRDGKTFRGFATNAFKPFMTDSSLRSE
jgi:thiamine biosynthesis lipoprotein